jgi:hypothetical protein
MKTITETYSPFRAGLYPATIEVIPNQFLTIRHGGLAQIIPQSWIKSLHLSQGMIWDTVSTY